MSDRASSYLKKLLLQEHSKIQTLKIVNYVGGAQDRFDALFDIFSNDEYRLILRASWAINYCIEKHPFLIASHYTNILKLLTPSSPNAVKRNITRMLQFVEIPEEWTGSVYDQCFSFVTSVNEPIAVRCFSMQVLNNISLGIPELENELRELLMDIKELESPGIRTRSRKLLKLLDRKSR